MEIDFHGYHPDDIVHSGILDKIVEQAWQMGEEILFLIHGHGRNRGISPGFVNTNTGYCGLTIRSQLRHPPRLVLGQPLVDRATPRLVIEIEKTQRLAGRVADHEALLMREAAALGHRWSYYSRATPTYSPNRPVQQCVSAETRHIDNYRADTRNPWLKPWPSQTARAAPSINPYAIGPAAWPRSPRSAAPDATRRMPRVYVSPAKRPSSPLLRAD
jgi:hypothetical protein